MKALLLAAGYGLRLRPLTNHIPKCLVPIAGKPLLEIWLSTLCSYNFDEIYINTHYLNNIVQEYLEKSKFKNKVKVLHENNLFGTAGTIRENYSIFKNSDLFVAHADNLSKFNIKEFVAKFQFRPKHIDITMMTFLTDSPQLCGILKLNEYNEVINFYEKSKNFHGNLANGAVYLFSSNVIDYIYNLEKNKNDLSLHVINKYIGKINTFHNVNYHLDIGNYENLNKANNDIEKGILEI